MSVAPREERTGLGLSLMALAVVFFTCIDTTAKWLILAGVAPLQAVFCRYAGHFLIACVIFVPRDGPSVFRSRAPWRQLLRSALLGASTMFNFAALSHLPITVTTTIFFAGPIVVTLLAIPILGERVGIHRIAAVCAGFFGVLVVMQPWGTGFDPAMILSLCALACASGYFILTRMLAGIEANGTAQLWSAGLPTLALAPVVWPLWHMPDQPLVVVMMSVIGLFGALGHIATTRAHTMADASILAPVVYIQILLAAIAGILVFATWPTVWTLGGGGIIIAAGLYIWHRERRARFP
ncbi:DMT family transporter [Aestuariicoccus sp. MJ-SS9]|uniref:DMT family transporter n=1 Tax=Aestuariicoccus sp. MJ-SS9 TaxID=3079855 RepID=UPI002914B48E|nr:DMT family transporter [Aestuariicoccus sp. MJ-SS9]MDU8909812.1 DMT family transporter [Aestuariicoccus sp. MJ-SS9]